MSNNGFVNSVVRKRATALDVSRLAGVARSTVSRAVTNPSSVREETLQRIRDAMATLKYRPSAFGRGLVSGKQGVLGIVTDTQVYNHRRDNLVDGIDRRINKEYWIGATTVSTSVTESELERLPMINQHTCDGFIFNIEASVADIGGFCRKHLLPAVFVNPTRFIPHDSVVLDDEAGTIDAVAYLVSKGHKRIAYLTGVGSRHDLSLSNRERGYELSMLREGFKPSPAFSERLSWSVGQSRTDAVEGRVREWLELNEPPTAILTYDYNIAMDLMRVAYINNWRIPEKFSVMSCDDAPFLNDVVVPISAMRTDWTRVGQDAVEMLMHKIEDPERELPNVMVKSSVIERKSIRRL